MEHDKKGISESFCLLPWLAKCSILLLISTGMTMLSELQTKLESTSEKWKGQSFTALKIWHPKLPFNVFSSVMRIVSGKLATDDALYRFGGHDPSKCSCCKRRCSVKLYLCLDRHTSLKSDHDVLPNFKIRTKREIYLWMRKSFFLNSQS